MFELLVEGPNPRQRLRHLFPKQGSATIGRHEQADVAIPWENFLSRRHVELTIGDEKIDVRKLPGAGNPLFFAGNPTDQFSMRAGDFFVIGSTRFLLRKPAQSTSPSEESLLEQVTFQPQELASVRFRDADRRIEVLSHLPDVISGSRSEADMYFHLVNLILAGVAHAEAVAIVQLDTNHSIKVLHWDRRRETAGPFQPSLRLAKESLENSRRTVLHVWSSDEGERGDAFTHSAEVDWAFCTPVTEADREPWGLYIAGRMDRSLMGTGETLGEGDNLRADVKFVELLSAIVRAVIRTNQLERQQSGLRQFFASPVLAALGDDLNTDLLEPRDCDVTVLFCDLRGFSRQADQSADNLRGLLDRVSRALGVMTEQIHAHGGVTGDFQGDAALGFWGWPFASDDSALKACRAALGIRDAFSQTFHRRDHPLAGFHMGIGIAHGRAVAGKIGTSDQVKITVFGPVVNLASRLEGMTKQLQVPIIIDEATAAILRSRDAVDDCRLRKLAKILPYGMENHVVVSELLPAASVQPELTDELIRQFERGVDDFIAGDWESAYRSLHGMPAGDRAQDFLSILIAQHNRAAPANWDGIIRLPGK
ncbi:MAG: adenylate/guanylate cyclase domain-containing protein [Planctomycetota bacterium]|nr:adenylate/guanylate cyclase domain-containing protein [Planctomycetota bacterium]